MRFRNCVIDPKVARAIAQAELMLNDGSALTQAIKAKNDFKYDSGPGDFVALQLLKDREPISVFIYKEWKWWSKVIGYFDGKAIYINNRKLQYMTHESIVANLLHEYSHYCGFSHGNNYRTAHKGLYSVPYYISDNIKDFI
jgi:hypothetical protein